MIYRDRHDRLTLETVTHFSQTPDQEIGHRRIERMALEFSPQEAEVAMVEIRGLSKPKKLCTILNLETQWVIRAERVGRFVHLYWRKNVTPFAAMKSYVERVEKEKYRSRVSIDEVYQDQLSFLDHVDDNNQ